MSAVAIIAAKEFRDGLRNRWVLMTTMLMVAFALALTLLGGAPTGTLGASPLAVAVVNLSSLTIFLVPLIALLMAYDAVAGEIERGTMALLLSYPVGRSAVIGGKFIGHTAILAVSIAVGYGAAAGTLALHGGAMHAADWLSFAAMAGSSLVLGMSFVALGYLASALVRDPRTAAAIALGLWLFFALIYDIAVLGLLVADQGRTITTGIFNVLLLGNPTDIYRMFNLAGLSSVRTFAGMAGLAEQLRFGPVALLSCLVLWTAAPLAIATLLFARREV